MERATPSASTGSSVSRRPAVSTSVTRSPSKSTTSVTRSRVVPGISLTMARAAPASALNRLGLADIRIADNGDLQAFAHETSPPPVLEQQCRPLTQSIERIDEGLALHEMITLIWKIDRRLEARDEIEQLSIEVPDGAGERSVKLIERGLRLQWRDSFDEICNGLSLHEIDASIEEGSQRELTGFRVARAATERRFHDRPQHDGAAVRAQLDDVVSGVRMGGGKVGGNGLIDRPGACPAGPGCCVRRPIRRSHAGRQDPRKCGMPGRKVAVVRDQLARDPMRRGSAQTHHADASTPRRSSDGHDGI